MVNLPGNPVARLSEYELRHLVPHLEESGRVEELHRLLALETTRQTNAWFEARQAYGDIEGYLEDVRRAWRLAEESYVPSNEYKEARSLGLQVRYALITSSVHNLARKISPKFLAALVDKGVWTPQLAFEYAKRSHNYRESLKKLAPYLDVQHLIESIALVWDLPEDQKKWVCTLADLGPGIFRKLAIFALTSKETSSQSVKDLYSLRKIFGEALAKLVEKISVDEVHEALMIARALSDDGLVTVPALISQLVAQGLTDQAVGVANDIKNRVWRAKTLNQVLPYLTEDKKEEISSKEVFYALQEISWMQRSQLHDDFILYDLAMVLSIMIPFLPSEGAQRNICQSFLENIPLTRQSVSQKALEIAYRIQDKAMKSKILAHLALVLPEEERLTVLNEVLALVKEVDLEIDRYQVMEMVAEQLKGALWDRAFDIVKSEQYDFWKCHILRPLFPFLPNDFVQEATSIVLSILPRILPKFCAHDVLELVTPAVTKSMLYDILTFLHDRNWTPWETVACIAKHLDEPTLSKLLQITFPSLERDEEQDDDEQLEIEVEKELVLEALAPHLSKRLIREALSIPNPKPKLFSAKPDYFRKMQKILIPQLARLGHPEEVISAIQSREINLDAGIISIIAPHLSEAMLTELLKMINDSSSELDALAPYLSANLLYEALKRASFIGDKNEVNQTIGEVAKLLAQLGYIQASIDIITQIEDATRRANILTEIIDTSVEAGRTPFLSESLKAARQIDNVDEKIRVVIALMPYLSEMEQILLVDELMSEMKKDVESLQADDKLFFLRRDLLLDRQIQLLTGIAERLPQDKRQPFLAKALSLVRGDEPIVSLPSPDLVEKFTELDSLQQSRVYLLLNIVENKTAWQFIRRLLATWASEDTEHGIDGLFGLLTWLPDSERFLMLIDAYEIAWEMQDRKQRARMFAKLLPLYPPGFIAIMLEQVLAAIRLIDDEVEQYALLNELIAYIPEGDEKRRVYRELSRLLPTKSRNYHNHYEEPFVDRWIEMDKDRRWFYSFASIVRYIMRKVIRKTRLKFPTFEPAFKPTRVSRTFSEHILGGGKDANFRNRVQALTRIASLLPDTERKVVLYEVLEIIHSMDTAYDRANALLKLFPLFAEGERLQIFQEAIADAWNCKSIPMLFSSLIDLIPHFTEAEKTVVIPEILKLVLKGGEQHDDYFGEGNKVLQELLPHLSETQIYEALDALRSFSEEGWKLEGIITIAVRLVELGQVDEGFNLIVEIPNEGFYNIWYKGWGLSRIAFYLPESLVRRALEWAKSLPLEDAGEARVYKVEEARSRAISALSFRLAELGYVQEALKILQEAIAGNMWYALGLIAFTDLLPERERTELIIQSLSVTRSLTDSRARAKCLDATRSQWLSLPADVGYLLWKEWWRDSGTRTRADLLTDISSLVPIIAVYGLGSALYETAKAVLDVSRWWS